MFTTRVKIAELGWKVLAYRRPPHVWPPLWSAPFLCVNLSSGFDACFAFITLWVDQVRTGKMNQQIYLRLTMSTLQRRLSSIFCVGSNCARFVSILSSNQFLRPSLDADWDILDLSKLQTYTNAELFYGLVVKKMVSRNKGEQVKKCLIVFWCSRVVQKANAKAVSALMSSKRVLTKMKTTSASV